MTKECRKQFSVKSGTIFEDSPVPLDKWLTAVWLIVNCKNGISSYEIARDLDVTQKSAWFMLHRIRLALQSSSWEKLGGNGDPVEIDETFVGGKLKNMHKSKRVLGTSYKGGKNKAIVLGMLERGGKVRAEVIQNRQTETMQRPIHANVEVGAHVITDEHTTYPFVTKPYYHEVINHAEGYVREHIHTNGIENFWALLKRGLGGTYIAVEPFHLSRYVDEQMFRYNNRSTPKNPLDDADRFMLAVSQISGKRLTYAELTGKVAGTRN